ncbi:blue-sensitive opsin [Xiphophorus maculatus]|uniref:Violet/blue-sensitive opsin n=5 Tax=Poeciliinae TaxID=586240 RepID=Q0H3C3_POERE|nr:blue-sensitive opsin [Poecilia reticulata]XP_005800673.1 blue-sensitive opsin [Xiphophorus maculatus]ABB69698.1 violet/blue-sensitive opsin [Poecilia reticulata]AQZ42231.1 SWS2B [Poecilia petenensis]
MKMRTSRQEETPDDFWIPIPLETDNITALSPYLVPQDHLGSLGLFYSMSALMFFLFVAGTAINVLTIACTIQYKKLRSHLNYILVNMAVANLIVSSVGSFTCFYCFAFRYMALGPLGCKIEGFTASLGGMVSLWSLAVIAFERWLVICKPLGNFAFKSEHALFFCALTWFFALCAAVPPLVGWSRYIPEGMQCSCGPDWYTTGNKYNTESFVLFLFCFCFSVPFTCIVFCYSQLLFTLKSAAKAQAESASTQKAEKEVTRMVVVMVLGFLVCYMPYASFALWVVNHRGQTFDLRLATIPSCVSKASTVYNPVIYVLLNKQFRSCMRKMLGMSGGDEEESSASQSVTEVSKVGPS